MDYANIFKDFSSILILLTFYLLSTKPLPYLYYIPAFRLLPFYTSLLTLCYYLACYYLAEFTSRLRNDST